MAIKANDLLSKVARALCALLGAPPSMRREPAPAVVLLTPPGRSAADRVTAYRRRYSRYLAATGGDECC
ncbi:MAG TPA: hypothetical protein VK066_29645 [Chloroflexota bacterium]|nr:hypothetical protein [Chloroflexota bacterium]